MRLANCCAEEKTPTSLLRRAGRKRPPHWLGLAGLKTNHYTGETLKRNAPDLQALRKECVSVGGVGREAQGFHYGVVEVWADFGNVVIFTRGIDAVRQQHDEKLFVRVEPDGCAGKTGVAVAMRGKIVAAGTSFGRHHPAQGPRVFRQRLRRGEFRNGGALQDAFVAVNAAVQQHLAKAGQVRGSAEDSRVAGNAADGEGIFIVHFALQQAVAQLVVEFRRRDFWPKSCRWTVHRALHLQRAKNIFIRQFIEWLAGQALNDFRHQNNSQIRIHNFGARLVFQRLGKNSAERVGSTGGGAPVLLERWQTRGMGHQVANRDAVAPVWLRAAWPFRQVALDRRVEIQRRREVALYQFLH